MKEKKPRADLDSNVHAIIEGLDISNEYLGGLYVIVDYIL